MCRAATRIGRHIGGQIGRHIRRKSAHTSADNSADESPDKSADNSGEGVCGWRVLFGKPKIGQVPSGGATAVTGRRNKGASHPLFPHRILARTCRSCGARIARDNFQMGVYSLYNNISWSQAPKLSNCNLWAHNDPAGINYPALA